MLFKEVILIKKLLAALALVLALTVVGIVEDADLTHQADGTTYTVVTGDPGDGDDSRP